VDLGEGALWDVPSQQLFWIDIMGKKVMAYNDELKLNRSINMTTCVGTVVPRKSGGLVAATQSGLIALNNDLTSQRWLSSPPFANPFIRFNDGKCDAAGRLFVGSMLVDTTKDGGALWRLDKNSQWTEVSKAWIPNGIAWSLDHKVMYWTDTMTSRLDQFDYDIKTGIISNRRTCLDIPKEMGLPDGITLDADGYIWIAHWEGYIVSKWNPLNGALLHTIPVVTGRVSSVAFGGPHLTDLYITTACFPPGHGGIKPTATTTATGATATTTIDNRREYGTDSSSLALSSAVQKKRDDSLAGSLFVVRNIGRGVAPTPLDI